MARQSERRSQQIHSPPPPFPANLSGMVAGSAGVKSTPSVNTADSTGGVPPAAYKYLGMPVSCERIKMGMDTHRRSPRPGSDLNESELAHCSLSLPYGIHPVTPFLV